MKALALALSLFPAVFAASQPCSGSWTSPWCICLDHNRCTALGGTVYKGIPGDWPCPSDGASIQGCQMVHRCPGRDTNTACTWRKDCAATILPGKKH